MNSQWSDFMSQTADDSKTESSYTLTNLVYQGRYQFFVVAFTSQGQGEMANVTFNIESGKLLR